MRRDEVILAAAADLFFEKSFASVGVDEIGERAGITGPAIYRHFASKEEILETLLDQAMDGLLRLVGTPDGGDPDAALERLIAGQVEFALADRTLVSVYAREARSLGPELRRRVTRRQRDHVGRWVQALRECYPDCTEAEALSTAHACIGLTLSVAHWPKRAATTDGLRDLLVRLLRCSLAALEPASAARVGSAG